MDKSFVLCTQELLTLLNSAPPGHSHILHSSLSTKTLFCDCMRTSIMYTYSIHDTYSVVYTETTSSDIALQIYTDYSPRMIPGGKLIYYMDYDRRDVNHALHMISTNEFEITYGSCWVVFTKTLASSTYIPTLLHIEQ
jgi:hypothetical protein